MNILKLFKKKKGPEEVVKYLFTAVEHNSFTNLVEVFLEYASKENLSKEAYKRGLCYSYWVGGRWCGAYCRSLFEKFKEPYLWRAEQWKEFNSLPEEITLYRGVGPEEVKQSCCGHLSPLILRPERLSVSWSLIKERAIKFSCLTWNVVENKAAVRDGFILSCQVPKERIKTIIIGYNKEIVFCPKQGDEVKVEKVDSLKVFQIGPLKGDEVGIKNYFLNDGHF